MYISDELIDKFIKEDVPYIDLTTLVLEIGNKKGKIQFFSREEAVICGTEEAARIFHKLNIELTKIKSSGSLVNKNEVFLEGKGSASDLHMAWKICQNIIDYSSGIATKTKKLVDKAANINSDISVITTRKNIPGTKELAIKAVVSGGGFPHRLGLSETILIFKQHLNFLGGIHELAKMIKKIKGKVCEKKVIAEVDSLKDAVELCKNGIDGIQFDKVPCNKLKENISILRNISPSMVILAAGGINESNIEDYVETGIDAVVTTCVYYAKPIDIGCKIEPIEEYTQRW
ncbi:ModD protein [Clostridium coskatii]|uniref:Putative pyrophosphorylase ModD n=1 Tax=Clostridium coskatii TaxID=1705578 RepID=A0A162LH35_9CLOT|nr:ModD protein [Clostridium coskatii]OAA93436.1 putative nicotinate-nucleotide pyrophosphorylase [carboxylating] [Clostridium coskatii]OBR96225.1 putative nicotinate-nucleotide pyrophosphorylase [Clostridium coskatii]